MFKQLLSAVVALLGATMASAHYDSYHGYPQYHSYPTEYKFTKVCSDSLGYYYYYPKSCRAKAGWYYRPYSYVKKAPTVKIVEILIVKPYKYKPHHKKCWHYCTKAHGCGWYTVPKPNLYYTFYKQYVPAVTPSAPATSKPVYSYYNPPASCVQAPKQVLELHVEVTIDIVSYFTSYCFFAYQPVTHYYYTITTTVDVHVPAPSPSPVPPPPTEIKYVNYICWGDCCFYQLPLPPAPSPSPSPVYYPSPSPSPVQAAPSPSPSPTYHPSPSPSPVQATPSPSPSPAYPSPSPSPVQAAPSPSPSPAYPSPSPSPAYPSPSPSPAYPSPSPSPVQAAPSPSPSPSPAYPSPSPSPVYSPSWGR